MPVRNATVLPDGILRLDDWLPYQCSVITNRVSAMLARMYHEEFGIGVVEWRLLANLGVNSPMSAKALAEATVMDQVSVTRALNLLVKKKLVSRRVDGTDRRKVVLRLSKTGAQAYERIMPLAQAIGRELTEALAPAPCIWSMMTHGKRCMRSLISAMRRIKPTTTRPSSRWIT